MERKLISKILGLFAVIAIVSACGKNSTPIGGGSSATWSPISAPGGVTTDAQTIMNSLNSMTMNAMIGSNCFGGGCSFKTKSYNVTYNTSSWWIFTGTTSDTSLQSTTTTVVYSATADQVITDAGPVSKTEILNRVFHPELDTSYYGQCGGSKSIYQVSSNYYGNSQSIDFLIAEVCNGQTVYVKRSHVVDLSYPLIMQPIQKVDYTLVNGQSRPSKVKVNSYQ